MNTQSLCASGVSAVRKPFIWIAICMLGACSSTSTMTPVEPAEDRRRGIQQIDWTQGGKGAGITHGVAPPRVSDGVSRREQIALQPA